MGSRWPDEHGLSITSTEALFANHGDPADQFEHFLRSKDDDYDEGSRQALDKSREFFKDRVLKAAEYLFLPPEEQIVEINEYVEFYGVVSFKVYAPAFYLGTALHALEDSFSHTVRSDDLTRVLSVLNFTDAVSGSYNEERDGIAHSYHMDECSKGGDNEPIIEAAEQRRQS